MQSRQVNNGTGVAPDGNSTDGKKSGWASFMGIIDKVIQFFSKIGSFVGYVFFEILVTPNMFMLLSLAGAAASFMVAAQAYTNMLGMLPSLSVGIFPFGNMIIGYAIALAIQIVEIAKTPEAAPWITKGVIAMFRTKVYRKINPSGSLNPSQGELFREKGDLETMKDWARFGTIAYIGDWLIALQQIAVNFVLGQNAMLAAGNVLKSIGIVDSVSVSVVNVAAAIFSVFGPEYLLRCATKLNRGRITVPMASVLRNKNLAEREKKYEELRKELKVDGKPAENTIAAIARKFDLSIIFIAFGDVVWSLVKGIVSANTLLIVSGLLAAYCFMLELRLIDTFLKTPFWITLLVAGICSMLKILPTAYRNFPEFWFNLTLNIAFDQDVAAGNEGLSAQYKKVRSAANDRKLGIAGHVLTGLQLFAFLNVLRLDISQLMKVENVLPMAFFIAMSIWGTLFFVSLASRAKAIAPDARTMDLFNKAEENLRNSRPIDEVVTWY